MQLPFCACLLLARLPQVVHSVALAAVQDPPIIQYVKRHESPHVADTNLRRPDLNIQEWTAMGDSYAAGIGAGSSISRFDYTCFRFNGAYPSVMNTDIAPQRPVFNNVACSGEKFPQIISDQFLDTATLLRPAWGNKPQFVTLTMGGNDLGFKELVSTCVYSIRLFTTLNCTEIIENAQRTVDSPEFHRGAVDVIHTALTKGTQRTGQSFKVFVTGYAQFFNDVTTQCNDVTFKAHGSFWHANLLTVEFRQTLNELSRAVNVALQAAINDVNVASPGRVIYVDYDALYQGHRFCDRIEPNPLDPETWFFTLGSKDNELMTFLDSIPRFHEVMSGVSELLVGDEEFFRLTADAAINDPIKQENSVAVYRIFHPKSEGHRAIEGVLKESVVANMGLTTNGSVVT